METFIIHSKNYTEAAAAETKQKAIENFEKDFKEKVIIIGDYNEYLENQKNPFKNVAIAVKE